MLRSNNTIVVDQSGGDWHAGWADPSQPSSLMTTRPPVPAIDIVSGIWTEDALAVRPGWQDQFFAGKMKSKANMKGVTLEQHLELMAEAGVERAFLFAPKVDMFVKPVALVSMDIASSSSNRRSEAPAMNSSTRSSGAPFPANTSTQSTREFANR